MSTNCINCVKNKRTGADLLCDECRKLWIENRAPKEPESGIVSAGGHWSPNDKICVPCDRCEKLTSNTGDEAAGIILCDECCAGKMGEKYWQGIARENAELRKEKLRRIYYQDIVYHVCRVLDRVAGRSVARGNGIVCGTADSPTTEVRDALKALEEKILVYIPRKELETK